MAERLAGDRGRGKLRDHGVRREHEGGDRPAAGSLGTNLEASIHGAKQPVRYESPSEINVDEHNHDTVTVLAFDKKGTTRVFSSHGR